MRIMAFLAQLIGQKPRPPITPEHRQEEIRTKLLAQEARIRALDVKIRAQSGQMPTRSR